MTSFEGSERNIPPLILGDESGDWGLTGDETLVHFYVPLETPLDLPDLYVFRFQRRAFDRELPFLFDHVPPDDSPSSKDRSLVPLVSACSIRIVQIERPVHSLPAFEAALMAAARSLPDIKYDDDDIATAQEEEPSDGGGDPDAQGDISNQALAEYWTCAEIVMAASEPGDRDKLLMDLAQGLDCIRTIQLAVYLGGGRPCRFASPDTLPAYIPYLTRRGDAPSAVWHEGLSFLQCDRLPEERFRQPEPKEDDRLRAIVEELTADPDVFVPRRLLMTASVQMGRGDYQASILSLAASCESMLDYVLAALVWEERRTPEEGHPILAQPLRRRSAKEFALRIGGEWRESEDGPVARWAKSIAEVRNAIIHRGFEPTREDSREAMDATVALSAHIGSCLRTKDTVDRFPRTVGLFSGGNPAKFDDPELHRKISELRQERSEPHWISTLGFWRRAVATQIQVSRGELKRIPHNEVYPIAVVSREWLGPVFVLWWQNLGVATRVERLPNASKEQLDAATRLAAKATEPQSVWIQQPLEGTLPRADAWVLEYHLMPERGVMVDRSDLDGLRPPAK